MNRSWLFVPGDDPRKIDKGAASDADAIILDLEDSVAPGCKVEVCAVAAEALAKRARQPVAPQVWVRVNALDTGLTKDDLAAVLPARPDGLVLPKCEGSHSHAAFRDLAAQAGPLPPILAIASDTAASLFGLGTYAGDKDRLMGLTWGAEDLAADLGASAPRDAEGG